MSEEVPLEEVQTGEMGAETVEYTGKFEEVPLGKMGKVPLGKMGVPYVQDHDDVDIRTDIVNDKRYWNSLLRYQKMEGNPVLYGKPTKEIVEILIRLYHANLLRVAFLHTRETINEDYSNAKGPYQFMTGLAKHNDKIYMTISEDPQEDTLYFQKIRTLIQMLKFCNINIDYEGYESEDFFAYDIHDNMTKSGKTTLYPTDYYGITATFKGKQAESNHGLTISEWDKLKIGDKCYLADYPAGAAKNKKVPFDPRLFVNELSVTLVNSYDYLKKRRDGVGYYPFRRQDEGHPGKYSCNNGSTCVESKLFSYLRDKQGLKTLNEIEGETAYWIGNKLPPNHILTKYSYCDGTEEDFCFDTDSDKLDGLVEVFRDNLDEPIREMVATNPQAIFTEIVRPFALPCPGCLKNWSNYNGNTRTAFDYNQCIVAEYVQATSRKAKAAVGPDVPDRKGGSRTRARRTKTRKTKMRQTRTRKTRNGTVKRRRNKYSHARLTR